MTAFSHIYLHNINLSIYHSLMAEFKKSYITLQDLKLHNKPGDIWIAIHGKVYDVSTWVTKHPGGDLPLLYFAGQDVTDAFLAYHPSSAWKHLDAYFNGFYLKDYSVSSVSNDFRKLLFDFTKMSLFEKKGHVVFVTLCFIMIMFALSVYGVLCYEGGFVHLICGLLMGFVWTHCGWLVHDSGHYQIMIDRKFGRIVEILTGNLLAGISISWWKGVHNTHHIAVNSLDYDPDMQHMPFLAVSYKLFNSLTSKFYNRKLKIDAMTRFLVSYQHFTFYPVMCFARLNLLAQSIMLLLSKKSVPYRVLEICGVSMFWIWYPLLVSFLPNWGERLMFVLASLSVTGIQHVQFYLNHSSSSVYIGNPCGSDWFEKQTNGTLNINCASWMDWFHGGLQFQIEHHLFPRLPRCQLRKVSPFVRELCKKHGLNYDSASFFKANEMTLRVLRNTAMLARDHTMPIPKNLVWEAVNTQG